MKQRDIDKLRLELDAADASLHSAISRRIVTEQRVLQVRDRLKEVNSLLESLIAEKAALTREQEELPKTVEAARKTEEERKRKLRLLRASPVLQRILALERELKEVRGVLERHPQEVVRDQVKGMS